LPSLFTFAATLVALFNSAREALRVFDGRDAATTGVIVAVVFTAVAVGGGLYAVVSERNDFVRGAVTGSVSVSVLAGVTLAFAFATNFHESVEISRPSPGDTVSAREIVRGSFQRLGDGESIWVAIVPLALDEYRFHPQTNATLLAGGKWQATAYVGIEGDVGREFEIHVLVATREGDERLQAYLNESRTTGSYAGLLALPVGVTSYDKVAVVRGNE
jgi:hypothetical protein